jgi:hypothetical protein
VDRRTDVVSRIYLVQIVQRKRDTETWHIIISLVGTEDFAASLPSYCSLVLRTVLPTDNVTFCRTCVRPSLSTSLPFHHSQLRFSGFDALPVYALPSSMTIPPLTAWSRAFFRRYPLWGCATNTGLLWSLTVYCHIYKSSTRHRTVSYKRAAPLQAMEDLRGRRDNSYSFLTSALDGGEWSASRPSRALPPGKGPSVPTVQEAEWTPQPVWTQRYRKNRTASYASRIQTRPPIYYPPYALVVL